ncbi:TlpA family protein disulfide reductase, partial [Patescibacteria group bacterium]
PYLDFKKSDYDKAVASDKIVFLDFYANWCPTCRAEAAKLTKGFDSLNSDNIVGFRVNYNDDDTDEDEKNLASQFEVPYQHYKVVLINGEVVLTDGDIWDEDKLVEELTKYIK